MSGESLCRELSFLKFTVDPKGIVDSHLPIFSATVFVTRGIWVREMTLRFSLCMTAALLWGTAAFGACLPTKQHSCVDLSAIPNIAQEVVGAEKLPTPTAKEPPAVPASTYDGPTIGLSNAARRAPEISYHWSID
jgi:hypothetical protein